MTSQDFRIDFCARSIHTSQKLKIHMIYKIHIGLAAELHHSVDEGVHWESNDATVPTGGIYKPLIEPLRDNMRRLALGGIVGGRKAPAGAVVPVSSAGAVVGRVSYLMMFLAVVYSSSFFVVVTGSMFGRRRPPRRHDFSLLLLSWSCLLFFFSPVASLTRTHGHGHGPESIAVNLREEDNRPRPFRPTPPPGAVSLGRRVCHASRARLLTLGIQSQGPRVMNSTEDMVHHRFVCECMRHGSVTDLQCLCVSACDRMRVTDAMFVW